MTPADRLFRLRAVADRTQRWTFGTWYWGDAIAIDGLLAAHDIIGGPYRTHVVNILARWAELAPPSFDDALAPCAAVLRLVADGDLERSAGERVIRAIERLPRLRGLIPALEPHRPQFRFGVCIDALYHLPLAVLLTGRLRGDIDAELTAIRTAEQIMDVLRCHGGWAQWYDAALARNNGAVWARGLGWALLGLLDLLAALEYHSADRLESDARNILDLLASTQPAGGHWPAVLGQPDAQTETSTAAFFIAGSLHQHTTRIASPQHHSIARATKALMASVGADGTYLGVSADVLPSWDITSYTRFAVEPSPWSQGAALRALAALATSPPAAGNAGDPAEPRTEER